MTKKKVITKPGIYTMSDEEYFAHPAVSNSDLKKLARSPAHFKEYKANPPDPTPMMAQGTAIHVATLEPDAFQERYAILPDNAPPKPTQKMIDNPNPSEEIAARVQFWNVWEASNGGKIVLSNEKAAEYLHIGSLVRNSPDLAVFFNGGKAEQVIFANDPVTGILCKCKPDYLNRVSGYKVQIELKTTDDAREFRFKKKAYDLGYFQGAAWYTDLMTWSGIGSPDLYVMIVVERDAPYGIKPYELPIQALEYGQRAYRSALDLYAYCLENDHWPNYDTTIEPLNLPGWVKD